MKIPTEQIGSIPRTPELITAITSSSSQNIEGLYESAVKDTLSELEKTGSPVISDGEQRKSSFVTYALEGLTNLTAEGTKINFADGHFRQLPVLTTGPFRYGNYAVKYLTAAQKLTNLPVKQAVIAASALSLIYPQKEIDGYSKAAFTLDLINECEKDIRQCLNQGAYKVQMDFTEGRLSLKLDPSGGVLQYFLDLNNQVFDRFSPKEQQKLGVHVCPGADRDSTHSADIDYSDLLAKLFDLHVGSFYIQLASEPDRAKVLTTIQHHLKPNQTAFIGVIDVNSPVIETREQVRDQVLQAAEYIPLAQLGTTDDCGFSPFCDDVSTPRDVAFAKIKARIEGTALAEKVLQEQVLSS